MQTFLQQLLGLLITPPGNLIVHLVLVFSLMAAMQSVFIARRSRKSEGSGRILLGLSAILAGQLILFLSSGLAWQGIANPHQFLPPLDRAVATWGLAWIVWMWSFPKSSRAPDAINGLLNLIIIILFMFTLTAWSKDTNASVPFNATFLDYGWSLFPLFIAVIGTLFILLERPEGWGIGLGIIGLHLVGYVYQLMLGDQAGDFAPAVRFVQLASYPLLPSLAQRLQVTSESPSRPKPEETGFEEPQGERLYTAEPRTVFAWMQVAIQQDVEAAASAMTRAVAQTMMADLCFLAPTPNYSAIQLRNGYNSVRDEPLNPITLEVSETPNLASALQRGRPFRMLGDDPAVPDLRILAETLGLEAPGNLMSVPLSTAEENWGALILLSPYSRRVWTGMDQTYLITAVESMVKILNRPEPEPDNTPSAEVRKLQSDFVDLQKQLEQASRENDLLQTQLRLAAEQKESEPALESLLTLQQESQEIINRLQVENDKLEAALSDGTQSSSDTAEELKQMEAELRLSLEEVAHLQNALAGANMKILSMEMDAKRLPPLESDGQDVIAATLHELRQPVTSIFGYTDLLMTESVGLLGAIQRKLLERVHASSERISNLIDDLLHIVILEGGAFDSGPDEVDMVSAIDAAVEFIRPKLQEKRLLVRLDLPPALPCLQADKDAMEQVVINLLQNAAVVTPERDTITLAARVESVEDQPFLLLQVTDSGGGIAAEDLPRVFWRHYRPENPSIQGIGDKGLGLSVARVLVEAHGGRIWVDSRQGESSTFSVLLPVGSPIPSQTSSAHEITS